MVYECNQLGGAATFTTIKGSPGMMYFPILSEELSRSQSSRLNWEHLDTAVKHEHVASSYEETERYRTYHFQFASEIFGNVR